MTLYSPRNAMIRFFLSVLLLPGLFVLIPHESIAQDAEPFLSLGEKRELYSNVLEESRDIIVGLPSGYESGDETYPVVYLLDGPGHFHHTTGTARFLARNGRMPGVIVVAIPNTDRTRDLTPPTQVDSLGAFPTAGGADNFLEFISGELKPYTEAVYRGELQNEAVFDSHRALLGWIACESRSCASTGSVQRIRLNQP